MAKGLSQWAVKNDCYGQRRWLEQDLRARGDCNARSARLIRATDSQGLGSQIKWKHAMHLMRLLLSGISALREVELRVRLDEERDALLTIKRGERPWPDVNAWRLYNEFNETFTSLNCPSARTMLGRMRSC